MFRTFSNMMRVGDIRNKIIFTLLMLVIFRLGLLFRFPALTANVINLRIIVCSGF